MWYGQNTKWLIISCITWLIHRILIKSCDKKCHLYVGQSKGQMDDAIPFIIATPYGWWTTTVCDLTLWVVSLIGCVVTLSRDLSGHHV